MVPDAVRREARGRVDSSGVLAPLLQRLLESDPDGDGGLDATLNAVVDGLRGLVPCRASSLAVVDNPGGATVRIACGASAEALIGLRVPLGRGISGHAMAAAETVVVGDAAVDHRIDPEVDAVANAATILAVPLRVGGAVTGCVQLLDREGGRFGALDRAVIEDVAPYLALAAARRRSDGARPEAGARTLCRARLEGLRQADASQLRDVDRDLIRSFDRALLEQCRILPLRRRDDERLTAVVSDKAELYVLDDFQLTTGEEVVDVSVAGDDALRAALERVLGGPQDRRPRLVESIDTMVHGTAAGPTTSPESADALAAEILAAAGVSGVRAVWLDPESDCCRVRVVSETGSRVRREYPASLHAALLRRLGDDAGPSGRIGLSSGRVARWFEQPTKHGPRGRLESQPAANDLPALDGLGFAPESLFLYRDLLGRRGAVIVHAGPRGSDRHLSALAAAAEVAGEDGLTVAHPRGGLGLAHAVELSLEGGLGAALEVAFAGGDLNVVAGEVCDVEAARRLFEIAAAGARVVATLHAPNAVAALAVLSQFGVSRQRLEDSLAGVCAHRPLPRLCLGCREAVPVDASQPGLGGALRVSTAMRSTGCPTCGGSGRSGTVAAHEVLRSSSDIVAAVSDGPGELDRVARLGGMWTFADDLTMKVQRGVVSLDAARRALAGR